LMLSKIRFAPNFQKLLKFVGESLNLPIVKPAPLDLLLIKYGRIRTLPRLKTSNLHALCHLSSNYNRGTPR
jgi:hypothetical protein